MSPMWLVVVVVSHSWRTILTLPVIGMVCVVGAAGTITMQLLVLRYYHAATRLSVVVVGGQ